MEDKITQGNTTELDGGDRDEIKECCLNIFLNYAKLKNGEFILPYLELGKILKLTNIKECLSQNNIDILLKTVNPSLSLSSDQFMNFIVLLSNKLYPRSLRIIVRLVLWIL